MKKLQQLGILALALVALAGFGTIACEHAENADDTAMNEETGSMNSAQVGMAIDDVSIGGQLNEQGAIEFGNNNNEFLAGDPIYVAMEVGDAPAGTSVRIVWYGTEGTEIGQQTKTVAQGDHYLNFQASDTSSWAPGEYRAEVWADNEMANEIEFEIKGEASMGRDDMGAGTDHDSGLGDDNGQ